MIGIPDSAVVSSGGLKAPIDRTGLQHKHRRLAGLRFLARITFSILLGIAVALVGSGLAYQTAEPSPDCTPSTARINLVFMIDRSGSLANSIDPTDGTNSGRGQTYNVEIEGVRRSLLDPSVIPRDGSVSVGVVLFNGATSVPVTLTAPIDSDEAAQDIAVRVEALQCLDFNSGIDPCPSGQTDFGAAILEADRIARLRPSMRRVLIMSTDGGATDRDRGVSASRFVRVNGGDVVVELDVILMGLTTAELDERKEEVSRIVFPPAPPTDADPQPFDTDLPGAVEVINRTTCNEPKPKSITVSPAQFEEECGCQVRQFADFTRRALRSNITQRALTVTTANDPAPNTPFITGDQLSLRQAIEMANSNGGRTTITFDPNLAGKPIQPHVPLPPLAAPDITICGCASDCAQSIPDTVTCPLTSPSKETGCQRTVTIDGQGNLQDGILIRSNRDVVRGVRIVNFNHAGIVIQPVCPSDNTGFNRIENNKLEDNTEAGVCVLDPPTARETDDFGSGSAQAGAVTHNVGNTISMNDISGSETPIDLGSAPLFPSNAPSSVCDGPTANDVGDADAGPNTLLNHPQPFTAVTVGNTVTVTGMVTIPRVDCPIYDQAVVEIFAVTKIHPASGVAVVDAVTFFGRIFVDEMKKGAFSQEFNDAVAFSVTLADGPASPIDGYTATFTDRAGNTSELIRFCTGPPKPKLSPQSLEFARVDPSGKPSSTPQSQSFTIENCGCSELDLSLVSIERGGKDAGRLVNLNDSTFKKGSGFFSVKQINATGEPTPILIPKNNIGIDPGTSQRFSVEFNPVIPRVIKGDEEKSTGGLFAKHVLPADLMSTLNFQQTGSGELLTISLTGHVTTAVKLIDPDTPSDPASVTLTPSGDDELVVTFAVFDSNLDVNTPNLKVSYEFIENGGTILPEPPGTDLAEAIRTRQPRLVQGQSFIVIQRFSNAKQHKNVSSVSVTVFDGEKPVSASGTLVSLTSTASAQSLRDERDGALPLPIIKLRPAFNRNVQSAALPRPAVKRLRSAAPRAPNARSAIFKKRGRTQRNAHDAGEPRQ